MNDLDHKKKSHPNDFHFTFFFIPKIKSRTDPGFTLTFLILTKKLYTYTTIAMNSC